MLHKYGFTLIEVLVVIGLVSIIAFFAVPFSISQISENKAYDAAGELSSVIFLTQQYANAYRDGKAYGVVIEESQYSTFSSINETISDNLVGYWKMNEKNWSGVADEVVNSANDYYHGTGNGGVNTAPSQYLRGGSFDGEDDWINMGDISELSNTDEFTVSLWLKRNDTSNNETIFHKAVSDTQDISITLSDTNDVQLEVGNGANSRGYFNANGIITNGSWVHLAVVFDGGGSTDADKAKIFLNGDEKSPVSYETSFPSSTGNLGGQLLSVGAGYAENYLDGAIDELRVYNAALSGENVNTLYEYNHRKFDTSTFDYLQGVTTDVLSSRKVIVFHESSFRPNIPTSFNMTQGGSNVVVEINSEGLVNYYIETI